MTPSKILQTAFVVCFLPTVVFAEGYSFSISYTNESGEIKDANTSADIDVTGYALSGTYDVMDNVFLALGYSSGTSTVSVGALSGDIDTTILRFGAGYKFSDNLDEMQGTGSSTGIGLAFSNVKLSAAGTTNETSTETLIAQAAFGVSPSITMSISISSPLDNLGSSTTGAIGGSYYLSESMAITASYGISSAEADGVETSSSGFQLGFTITN